MIQGINVLEVAARCLRTEALAIEGLVSQLTDTFEHVVRLLYECRGKVVVTGVGKSGHVGAKIAATLSSTGTPAFYINPLDLYHGDLGVITRDDVVLALSNSGQTDELLRFIPYLKSHDIRLVGMSSNPDSLLAKYSNYHLTVRVESEACPLGLAPTSSTTAQLALGDALACALMEVRHFEAADFAQYHPGGSLGKRLLATARDIMRSENLPLLAPEATLADAILLISETKMGMAVAVDDGKVVGMLTDGDIRRAMLRLKERFFHVPVSEIMTRTPKAVQPDTHVAEIQDILTSNNIHAVLVLDDDAHLLGIVEFHACML